MWHTSPSPASDTKYRRGFGGTGSPEKALTVCVWLFAQGHGDEFARAVPEDKHHAGCGEQGERQAEGKMAAWFGVV